MASNTAVGLVPIGRRADGSTGTLVDGSGKSQVAVLEILTSLPTTDDANNFEGRLVFVTTRLNSYVCPDSGPPVWIALQDVAVVVGVGVPSPSPTPATGDLYYATSNQVLYLWDGISWVAVGGMRGADVIWQHYVGDGATSLYATGASTNPPVEFVQVFIAGLAKSPGTSAPTRDYYMVGGSVQLNAIPSNGALIAIRTLTFKIGSRNSAFVLNRYVSDGTGPGNSYGAGVLQSVHGQVFVTVDGVAQQGDVGLGAGTYDYRLERQNILITSMTAVSTTVTVTTQAAHGFVVGSVAQIFGAQQTQYNGTQTVTDVVSPTVFKYVAALAPSSSPAVPNPVLFFGPVSQNDRVVFVNGSAVDTNVPAGSVVSVRSIENIISTAAFGGVDTQPMITVSESGAGIGVYKEKSGSQLVLKTLVAGQNTEITETADEITVATRFNTFERYTVWNGVASPFTVSATDDVYIAVKNTSGAPVTVSLAAIIANPSYTGRRVIVKDAGQNAATNNISILPNASVKMEAKDGLSYLATGAPLVLNQNGESASFVFNGNDWEMTFRHPGVQGAAGAAGATGATGPSGTDNYTSRVNVDGTADPYVVADPVRYVGVNNTSGSSVTIDIFTNVANGASGRSITVKDEGGNAATHNIIVDPGPSRKIDGGSIAATLAINTNRGSVKLVFDGGVTYHSI